MPKLNPAIGQYVYLPNGLRSYPDSKLLVRAWTECEGDYELVDVQHPKRTWSTLHIIPEDAIILDKINIEIEIPATTKIKL